jgi:hypothetical protein
MESYLIGVAALAVSVGAWRIYAAGKAHAAKEARLKEYEQQAKIAKLTADAQIRAEKARREAHEHVQVDINELARKIKNNEFDALDY